MKEKIINLKLVVAIYFFLTVNAPAQISNNVTLFSQIGGGYINCIEARDNYLFIGQGTLLEIYDFTVPDEPKVAANLLLPNEITGLHTLNNYLLIGIKSNGLFIYDISIIDSPQKISEIKLYEGIISPKVLEDKLYIMLGTKGFRIFDITNIETPVEIAKWDVVEYTWDIEKIESYLLVADGTYGVRIIDVSDNTALKEVNRLSAYKTMSLELKDRIAYIANETNILIADFSDPTHPKTLKYYDTGAAVRDLIIEDKYTYIANTWEGLKILNITDPLNPTEVSNYSPVSRTLNYNSIVKSNRFIYIQDNGIIVLDASEIDNLEEIYNVNAAKRGYKLSSFYSNYLLIDGLKSVYDISDPSNPTEKYSLGINHTFPNTSLQYRNVQVKDTLLIIGAEGGLYIWNLKNIANPQIISFLAQYHQPSQITISENYIFSPSYYVSNIFDIRNLYEPFLVGTYNADGRANVIKVKNEYAYVANSQGKIQILDISRPTLPHLIQIIDSPYNCDDLEIVGNVVYSIENNGGLRIIDIANPFSPIEISRSSVNSDYLNSINIEGNLAYLLGYPGLRILDISTPLTPTLVGYYNFAGVDFSNLSVKDGLISVTSQRTGIYLLKFDNYNSFAKETDAVIYNFYLSQNYPNPFNPSTKIKYQIPAAGFVSLKIYDLLGREVATLVNEEKPAGSYEIEFNASNLSSGVYFYRLKSGSFAETKKLILMR